MALRDQPYLPLYVQDFLTDEKLRECSESSVGIYVFIMCIMHKSSEYGKILLKQKDKQTKRQIVNFAMKLSKHLPYSVEKICVALDELVLEEVLYIDGDYLCQKRMIKDGEISIKRSDSGSKGAKSRYKKDKKIAIAKPIANTEIEIDNESEDVNDIILIPFDSKIFKSTWDLWKIYKKKKKKFTFLDAASENRALNKLEKLSGGNEDVAIKIIKQSIDNGWSGLWELGTEKVILDEDDASVSVVKQKIKNLD